MRRTRSPRRRSKVSRLEENLAPIRKGARIIREISWRWREIGADGRICDLIDSQVGAIETACGQIASASPQAALERRLRSDQGADRRVRRKRSGGPAGRGSCPAGRTRGSAVGPRPCSRHRRQATSKPPSAHRPKPLWKRAKPRWLRPRPLRRRLRSRDAIAEAADMAAEALDVTPEVADERPEAPSLTTKPCWIWWRSKWPRRTLPMSMTPCSPPPMKSTPWRRRRPNPSWSPRRWNRWLRRHSGQRASHRFNLH